MGVSTDGCIAYGVLFEDGYEFPWQEEPFDGDIDDWWRKQNGYVDPIHDEKGNYMDEKKPSEAELKAWREGQRAFDAAHPLPVVAENYCSDEYPMIMLAIPSSTRSASRGEPEFIDAWPTVTDEEIAKLRNFIETYNLTPESAEGWWLYSYWG